VEQISPYYGIENKDGRWKMEDGSQKMEDGRPKLFLKLRNGNNACQKN